MRSGTPRWLCNGGRCCSRCSGGLCLVSALVGLVEVGVWRVCVVASIVMVGFVLVGSSEKWFCVAHSWLWC
jgi:hypothetical protein